MEGTQTTILRIESIEQFRDIRPYTKVSVFGKEYLYLGYQNLRADFGYADDSPPKPTLIGLNSEGNLVRMAVESCNGMLYLSGNRLDRNAYNYSVLEGLLDNLTIHDDTLRLLNCGGSKYTTIDGEHSRLALETFGGVAA